MSHLDDATLNLDSSGDGEFLRTGLDLLVLRPDGSEFRFPVCRAQTTLGSDAGCDLRVEDPEVGPRQAVLHYRQGQVFFANADGSRPVKINGETCSFRELSDQDEMLLGSHRVRLVGLLDHLASLEGYTDPYRDRHWGLSSELGSGGVPIGRPGKRANRVELEDPTVSRVHATIRLVDGAFVLEPETTSSPTRVNGDPVVQPRVLADGDLIQLGQQLLRFRTARGSARPRALLPQEATILFSDIWNYSGLAENRPLEETIHQMNDFYRAMGRVIEGHSGVLTTFLGDAMMAVFGADRPDVGDPVRAVSAALAMQRRLEELNREWESAGKPGMRIGVGINTGEVMVGDVGFTGKLEFAAMGDNTNLAARLEKLTREYGVQVIVSGSTHANLVGRFATRPLGTTRVKGRTSPVELFEVLGALG
ncbi:MAG: adenylate/guanylate cyclase domain-containing protein [Candidatus Eremiobacterota bacterium]